MLGKSFLRASPEQAGWIITTAHLKSGTAFSHLLPGVGDCALESLHVVTFRLADDFLDGARHSGYDFVGRTCNLGTQTASAREGHDTLAHGGVRLPPLTPPPD